MGGMRPSWWSPRARTGIPTLRRIHFHALHALVVLALLPACGPGRFDPDTVPEAYRRSTAALMWPGATRAFQITPAGDLYNGAWIVRVRAAAAGAPAGAPRVIAFEDRWLPVAHWSRTSGSVRWDFEAVALPEAGPPGRRPSPVSGAAPRDSGFLVSLEVRASNQGDAPTEATLELAFEPPDSSAAFLAFDMPFSSPDSLRWASSEQAAPALGWTTLPARGSAARISWPLGRGRTRTERFVLSSYPAPGRTLSAAARKKHPRWTTEARRFWEAETERGTRFTLGDPEVENAVRAALVVVLSCRERRGSSWVPIGNSFQYRDVWLRDGARSIQALAIMSYTDEARALAHGLSAYQWPAGAFLSQRGQLDGTGQALWAFEQALLRPTPDDSLERFAQAALSAWRWREDQRELGRVTGWRFGAMLPYADPRDNEMVQAQLVGNDAWSIAGYGATVRLLRAAGHAAEADSVAAARARYVADFEAALERTGSRDIPASWQEVGRDWGNLGVAYPCAALSADHPRCAAVARRVWSASGGAGLCAYARADSLHYYVGADLGTWGMLAGARASADSVLAAMLHWRSASGGAGEVFLRSTRDYGRNLPPHVTSAAALIALVRNAIVFDEGDTLRLTLGARDRWWQGARIRRAATRWGEIDVSFRRRQNHADWNWTAVPVWTALSLPPGARLAGTPPSPLVAGATPEVVLAPPGTRRARVVLAEARSARP